MPRDPIVDEVRRIRLEIEAEHGGAEAHLKQVLARQKALGSRLVSRKPRPRRSRKVA